MSNISVQYKLKDETSVRCSSRIFLWDSCLQAWRQLQDLTDNMTVCLLTGYQQANVVILHKDLADDFEGFCRANSSPLPLLYKSKCGEWSCGPLATGSDIRYLHTKVFTNRNETPAQQILFYFIFIH